MYTEDGDRQDGRDPHCLHCMVATLVEDRFPDISIAEVSGRLNEYIADQIAGQPDEKTRQKLMFHWYMKVREFMDELSKDIWKQPFVAEGRKRLLAGEVRALRPFPPDEPLDNYNKPG